MKLTSSLGFRKSADIFTKTWIFAEEKSFIAFLSTIGNGYNSLAL